MYEANDFKVTKQHINEKSQSIDWLFVLVAGTGLEPVAFGL
jgi:hypothetical protein